MHSFLVKTSIQHFFIWMKLPLGPHDTSTNTGDNALLFQSTQYLHCESAIVPVSVHSDSANGNILLLTNIVYVINKKKECCHFNSFVLCYHFMRSARICWPLPLEAAILLVLHMRMY